MTKKSEIENKLYEIVAEEIERGEISKGIWAKALSISEGDKEKTQAMYIKIRVHDLSEIFHQAAREEQEQQEKMDREANKSFFYEIKNTGSVIVAIIFWLFVIITIIYST